MTKQPFFRVTPRKLNKVLNPGTELLDAQQQIIDALEMHRMVVAIASRRLGKSYLASILIIAKILEGDKNVMVVSPNYALSQIIWEYVVNYIHAHEINVNTMNKKDRVIHFNNGSMFRLGSAESRDTLVGREYDLIIVDEAAVIKTPEFYENDLRPAMSSRPTSRILFISTPRGKHHYLYDYFQRGEDKEFPNWASLLFTYRDNPRLTEEDIRDAKRDMSRARFAQEYECDWTIFEDQIYEELTDGCLVRDLHKQKFQECFAALDVGFKDYNGFVTVGYYIDPEDGKGYYAIIDNFKVNQIGTKELADRIKTKREAHPIEFIFIDNAAQQTKHDLIVEHDLPMYDCHKGKSKIDSITLIQDLIAQGRVKIDPETAEETYMSLKSYRWKDNVTIPAPIHDEHSHLADAVRYAIHSHLNNSGGSISF